MTRREFVESETERLRILLGLYDWDIDLVFTKPKGKDALAYCMAQPEYKQARITFNLKRLKELDARGITTTVIHELIHCHVWKIAAWGELLARGSEDKLELCRQEEEHLTTTLERILLPLLLPEELPVFPMPKNQKEFNANPFDRETLPVQDSRQGKEEPRQVS